MSRIRASKPHGPRSGAYGRVQLFGARRAFPLQQQTTTDVSIKTNGLRDLYVAMGDERDGCGPYRAHGVVQLLDEKRLGVRHVSCQVI